MDHRDSIVVDNRMSESAMAKNRVLRRTYLLLAATLFVSAITAGMTMMANLPYPNILVAIVGMYGLLFLTQYLSRSVWGLFSAFAFAAFMGYMLGPILNMYIHGFSNGPQLVMTALGATGVIFVGLSAYAVTTKKDFSYLAGFLFVAVMFALLAMVANFFFMIPALQLAIAGAFVLISSGYILFQTSLIVNGGERNFIMATITLYVSIYNLFISLLQIFSAFSGRD